MLAIAAEHDVNPGGGATIFLTSLLDHPDFGPEHLAVMPHFGLGGAPVPHAVADRAEGLGIRDHPRLRLDRAPVDHGVVCPTPRRPSAPAPTAAPCPASSCGWSTRTATRCRRASPGEIVSRGPDLFVGYTDPALTAAAVDADGWYRTGDVGVLDDDGYLTITDRLSDIIIRGGRNLSAGEIEERVATMPAVAEVAVVAAPDARLGEHACAVVRLAPGAGSEAVDARGGPGPPGGVGARQAEVARGGAGGRGVRPHAVGQDPQAHPP